MVKDNSYGLMTSDEVNDLKKQLQKFNPKTNKSSSNELPNSINALTKKVDAMHKLINEAPQKFKVEEKDNFINEKLNKIMEQNNIIAGGIIAISEMIEDFTGKRKKPVPRQDFPEAGFQRPPEFAPSFNEPPSQQQEVPKPRLEKPLEPQQQDFEPPFNQPPKPQQQGPVAMPSIPFSDIEKPKKKGLFGFLKK